MSPNTHFNEEIIPEVTNSYFQYKNDFNNGTVKNIVEKIESGEIKIDDIVPKILKNENSSEIHMRKNDDINGNIIETKDANPTKNVHKTEFKYDMKNDFVTNLYGFTSQPIKWANVFIIGIIHLYGLYAIFATPWTEVNWRTIVYELFLGSCVGFGVTGGAHRYFAHKSYKAKLPVRLFLVWCFTSAGQNSIVEWVKDHRVHHKFVDTNGDPHNASRGFFFAHVGWLFMKKHPDVINQGRKIDCNDLLDDPVVRFHERYFTKLKLWFCFIMPTIVPIVCWNETAFSSWNLVILRLILTLHVTWSVNSFAHLYGWRPYNKTIRPVENWGVSLVAFGEGWHNFHHTFPWDYKASEHYFLNLTTYIIDFFAKLGLVYDRKEVSQKFIKSALLKYGDGSHFKWGHQEISETEFDNSGAKFFH